MKLSDQIALRMVAWRLKEAAYHNQEAAKALAERTWPTCKTLALEIVRVAGLEENDVCPDF